MTRQKYDYEQLILMPKFQESQRGLLGSDPDEAFRGYETGRVAFMKQNRASAGKWVPWTHGIETHNENGQYRPELVDWLKLNERLIEMKGYAEIGEQPNIWNPQMESWTFDERGEFKFSAAYWEYLLSEGYVKRWIECQENRMGSEFGALSYSFPLDHIRKRIMEAEIPNPSRYSPLSGLLSESHIYRFQEAAGVNPVRKKRLIVALEA